MAKEAIKVPLKPAHRGCPRIEFDVPNRWGGGVKVAVRSVCKNLPEYYLRIEPVLMGRDDSGNEIPVNTLGKWAFGVPGCRGKLMFEGGETSKIVIYYPEGSPPELLSMLEKAVLQLKQQFLK